MLWPPRACAELAEPAVKRLPRPVMNRRRTLGLLAALPAVAWAAPAAVDPIDRPARLSRLAERSALIDVARAGERLVAVGERGHVLLSDDQGRRWRQVEVPTSVTLTALHFADASHGWAVGHGGVILATRNGGEQWVKQLDGRVAVDRLVQALGAAASARQRAEGPDKPFLDVHFSDRLQGLAVGAYGLAFETRDGGQRWEPALAVTTGADERHLYALHAHAGNVWIGGEQGLLLRRAPDGTRVDALASPARSTLFALQAAPDGSLLAAGLGGHVQRSADGGASWTTAQPAGRAALTAAVLAGERLVLANEAGQLLVSSDGGRRFAVQRAPQPYPLSALAPAGPGRVVAVGLLGAQTVALDGASS